MAECGAMNPRRSPLARRELEIVLLVALLAFALHARFRVVGFGEPDMARNARDAVIWHFQNSLGDDDSRVRTSGLCIAALKFLLARGVPIRHLPSIMNWAGVTLGSITLVGVYCLIRRVVDARVAGLALALCALSPGIWILSTYGMPTVGAVGFFAF